MKLSREVKTALVAIVVLALAIWGYNFLKGKNIFKPTSEYYVVYENIEGVIESGYVYYRGYNVGNITALNFDPDKPKTFVVKFIVSSDLKIPKNSVVTAIQANPIASTKDLEIKFSNNTEFYKPGDTLVAGYDNGILGDLEPLKENLETTIRELNATLTSLNETLKEETPQDIKETIKAAKQSLQNIEQIVSPYGSLSKTLRNVESITGNIKNNNEKIDSTLVHVANISASLDSADLFSTIAQLDSTLTATSQIMNKINNGDGTAGLLINDSLLYMNLSSATASLDSLLVDLKAHPKRYVQVSVFGGKKK